MRFILVLVAFGALNACASDKTSEFFRKKLETQKSLELKPNDKTDELGRVELKILALEIIGPTQIDQKKYSPNYSVATLQNEPGADMLDGVIYRKENSTLFISTKKLLGLPQVKVFDGSLLDDENVRKAFLSDSAVIWKKIYKEESDKKSGIALVSIGQDVSNQGPNSLLTYRFDRNRIAMEMIYLDPPTVPKCSEMFDINNDMESIKLVAQCYVENLPQKFEEDIASKAHQSQTELQEIW